jgi:hypothetical protein
MLARILFFLSPVLLTFNVSGQGGDTIVTRTSLGDIKQIAIPTSTPAAASDSLFVLVNSVRRRGLLAPADLKTNLGLANIAGTWGDTSRANLYAAINSKAPLVSPSFTTPVLGVATGTSLTVTSALGFTTGVGAGGAVTQNANKTTGVTLNKITGQITMNNAALTAGSEAKFTVTNSTVSASDVIILSIKSGGTSGAYLVSVAAVAAGSFDIVISNASAGSLSEAIVISFAVIKGSSN